MVKELCNGENTPAARSMAAILFKNTIINANKEDNGGDFWFQFDLTLRQQIKDAFLSLLCDPTPSIVKDAGVCLGIIATVELPLGQWDEFLQMMSTNATNEDYKFRLAAV